MKHKKFMIGALIASTVSLLAFQPTQADVGPSSPTHKIFMGAHGIFRIQRIHNLCVPGKVLGYPDRNSYVRVVGTAKCEGNGLPYGLKKVFTEVGTGWMWDFALEQLEDEEKALLEELNQIPIKEEDTEIAVSSEEATTPSPDDVPPTPIPPTKEDALKLIQDGKYEEAQNIINILKDN
jgi:hypothetical protein